MISSKQNGIIITFGDNDTFPLWMLQDALGVRQDVTVLNVSLLTIPEYREKIFTKMKIAPFPDFNSNKSSALNTEDLVKYIFNNKPINLPIYIGLPAWEQFKEYEKNLYLEGLVLEYSKENIDNTALLKNNFENKYALDYLENRFEYDISSEVVDRMNINYLPGIFKLYEHYNLSGDLIRAQKMKELGLLIAQKGGKEWYDKATKIFK